MMIRSSLSIFNWNQQTIGRFEYETLPSSWLNETSQAEQSLDLSVILSEHTERGLGKKENGLYHSQKSN